MRCYYLLPFLVNCAAVPLQAQPSPSTAVKPAAAGPGQVSVDPGEGRAVTLKLADELVRNFVYPDQAKAYAAMLRGNAAGGRYDSGTRSEVAKRLTDDLMAVRKDGHLRVGVTERDEGTGEPSHPKLPPLIQSARTIAPGIGYIRFSAFFGTPEEMDGVRKWLADNRDAKTLIFDLRNHHGGGLNEQDVIFSAIFAERTPLFRLAMAKSIYDEHGSPFGEAPSIEFATVDDKIVATHFAVPGEDTALRHATVYVLTSNRSASAAEHFALALKSSGRATLIGEATAGANHFGGPAELDANFNVWMPIGRTYDIKTGKDWEGSGIAPDIAVDPSTALVVALEKAGLSHEDAERRNAEEIPAEPVHSETLKSR